MSMALTFPFSAITPIPLERESLPLDKLSSMALNIAGEQRKFPVS